MAVVTIQRLAEEIMKMLNGGKIQAASSTSFNEIKIAIGQVANSLLKTEYFQTNLQMGERIPNGMVLALYDGIQPVAYGIGKSKATLPIVPMKLPRNMGVFSIFRTADPFNEFIPLQMGQSNLVRSQPMINDLLGQVGYEVFGKEVVFSKNLTQLYQTTADRELSMRLAILDVAEYGDWDVLPILPEHEWEIKRQVVAMYSGEGITDKLVDSSTKEQQNVPITQQKQS
jgi:hypothetical protein